MSDYISLHNYVLQKMVRQHFVHKNTENKNKKTYIWDKLLKKILLKMSWL